MKKIRQVLVTLVVFAAFVLVFAWFWVTEPLLNPPKHVATIPSADAARIEGHVRKLTETFYPRDFSHPESLDRAATYIFGEFERADGKASTQPFQVEGRSYRNVIASFGPETEEVIVVGAHYDTHGELPGADDNASGVAGLLELAVLLGSQRLPLRVELVAYTLEELPFFGSREMGSAIHARSLHDAGVRVRTMFSLEMIGYFSDEPGSQKFPAALLRLFYPNRGNFIAVVGRLRDGRLVRRVKASMASATDLPVHSINAPPWIQGVDLSDHVNYWKLGFPAVMITDTAFFRNERYHTEEDMPETLDYARMAKVVDGVLRAVLDLAGA